MAKRFNFTPPELKEHFTRDILEENIGSSIKVWGTTEQEEFVISQIPFKDELLIKIANLKYQAMVRYTEYRSEDEVDELDLNIAKATCEFFDIPINF